MAGNRAGYDVTVSTYFGCPFVALRVYGSTAPPAVCDEIDHVGLRTIRALRPALVFVVNRTDDYTDGSMGLAQSGGTARYERGERLGLWTSGLRSDLAALSRASIPVVVVGQVPRISDAPTQCAVVRVLTRTCSASAPRVAVDAELAPSLAANERAARGLVGVSSLDLEDSFCTARRCSTIAGNRILYSDAYHLTVLGARRVTGRFATAIRSHART